VSKSVPRYRLGRPCGHTHRVTCRRLACGPSRRYRQPRTRPVKGSAPPCSGCVRWSRAGKLVVATPTVETVGVAARFHHHHRRARLPAQSTSVDEVVLLVAGRCAGLRVPPPPPPPALPAGRRRAADGRRRSHPHPTFAPPLASGHPRPRRARCGGPNGVPVTPVWRADASRPRPAAAAAAAARAPAGAAVPVAPRRCPRRVARRGRRRRATTARGDTASASAWPSHWCVSRDGAHSSAAVFAASAATVGVGGGGSCGPPPGRRPVGRRPSAVRERRGADGAAIVWGRT